MYQREFRIPSGGKPASRRRRRRRGNLMPILLLGAFTVFAAAAFLRSSPDEPVRVEDGTAPLPVVASVPDGPASPEEVDLPPEEGSQPDSTASLPDNQNSAEGPDLPLEDGAVQPEEPVPPAVQTPPDQDLDLDADGWQLLLVNPWNAMPEEYIPVLKQLDNGQAVDERCYEDLQAMMDACREGGYSPLICSSYRTQKKQESLFQNKISRLMAKGLSEEEARAEAAKVVAVPGTSEHQLGLALDIVDINHQVLDKSQEETGVQQWLMAHSWEYGFILRYPNDKSEITGIIYEPWHYRYVGRDAAQEIFEQGVCLEEYLDAVQGQ